eukprot:CAMPEP_0197840456 /NCGR_PEP_ID=MMETSP1437-20131217/45621_1 /TAXON_ID=49252 ORGANISM="Eucampia antarctica, Strain CCMP1452" /NCGR_SAMPLE_ID=MMETSP1437 /ASSEMBLY_ACC=CAM_ASM_001096 /LENGTH=54 /DNA_ID=CAMNT_0043450077 /DNA_START=597 /DNA_END=761 /DNA_ORIENTATION=+
MTSALEKIVSGFPCPAIDDICGHPNYDTISNIHRKLNANATSVHIAREAEPTDI